MLGCRAWDPSQPSRVKSPAVVHKVWSNRNWFELRDADTSPQKSRVVIETRGDGLNGGEASAGRLERMPWEEEHVRNSGAG